MNNSSKDVLIFFPPGLGNAVLLMAMLQAIREHEPAARIEMIITQKVVQDLLEPEGLVDKFIFYDNRRELGQVHYRISQLKLLQQLFGQSYTYYFCLDRYMKLGSILLTALIKAKIKIGYSQLNWFGKVLNVTIPFNAGTPETEQRLELLRGLGWQVPSSRPILHLTEEEKEFGKVVIQGKLQGKDIAVGIHPGSSENLAYKRWPAERFAELIDYLYCDYGFQPILFGGPGEKVLAESIKAHLKKAEVQSLIGMLSIRHTTACIAACDYFISNDSGLMHIAAAVRTPQLALFGATSTVKNTPQSPSAVIIDGKLSNRICHKNPILNITVSDVRQAFEKLTKTEDIKV